MPSKRETKEQRKATAALSKERLARITKARRHHIRTNVRVMKYGAKSFVRNAWLSVAAIAIMAVTLIVLSATLIATHAMSTALNKIEQQVDMSIYVKQGATRDQINTMIERIQKLNTVLEVSSTSPEDANAAAIKKIIDGSSLSDDEKEVYRENLTSAPNKLPWTLNVKLINLDNTKELEDFVNTDDSMKDMLDSKPPSYASGRRDTIDNINRMMDRIELIGLIAAAVFGVIAILVVFNTIRMAVYNRKEEIYMMRLVGASRWFIVGPFVVEACFYGIIAAAIAGAAAYSATFALKSTFGDTLAPTLDIMTKYWPFIASSLLVAGIVIGVVSSALATRKYLKQK